MNMPGIKIFTDTSSDMPEELQEKYNIGMFRFLSVFGEQSYVSGKDITNAEFYDMLKAADKIPTTSQTPFADMYDALLEASRSYDSVIYITISSKAFPISHASFLISSNASISACSLLTPSLTSLAIVVCILA